MSTCSPDYLALVRALDNLHGLDRIDAAVFVDQVLDVAIAALRRDQTLPARTTAEWRLVLGKVHLPATEFIHRRIVDHVRRDEVIRVVERLP